MPLVAQTRKGLPALTPGQIIVGNASGIPTAVTMSGDATMDSSGVVAINGSNHSHVLADITDAGTMASQAANNVAITGGAISGLTSLGVTGNTTLGDASGDTLTINGTAISAPNGLNLTGTLQTQNIGVNRVSFASYGIFASPPSTAGAALVLRGLASQTGSLFLITDSTAAQAFLDIAANGQTTHYRWDSGTNNTQNVMILGRNSTGTPAANFASRTLWQLESSTTENVDAASMVVSHVVATHASRTERVQHFVNDSGGAREYVRGEASGSAPMIGFLGAAAVARQALGAWAGLTTDQKLDALRDLVTNFGLGSYT